MTDEIKGLSEPKSVGSSEQDIQRPLDKEHYDALHSSVYNKTIDPTVNDDETQGYFKGSRWINETADKEFICLDPSTGSAIWKETTFSGAVSDEKVKSDSADPTAGYLDSKVDGSTIEVDTGTHKMNVKSGVYEPVFSKNTAFNKNFGSASDTVCEGDDSRLSDSRTPTSHASTHASGGGDPVDHDALQNFEEDEHRQQDDGAPSATKLWSSEKVNYELGLISSGFHRKASVKDYVDCTSAPPTEVTGDRYILDFTVGTVHADWDGASKGDVVEFNGAMWDSETPIEGDVAYIDAENQDRLYVDDGTPDWEARPAYPGTHVLGGAEHSPDTLANLNSKISDATLDDSSDPRDPNDHASNHEDGGSDEINVGGLSGELVDPQPPKTHNLGGSEHNIDSLANLNSKISDATLDDSSNPRTPTSHATSHENGGGDEISIAGLSGEVADPQPPKPHASSHEGGADAISPAGIGAETSFSKNTAFNKNFGSVSGTVCEGDDSRLSDARTPLAHKTSHQSGGSDAIKLDDLDAPEDNTDLNVSISAHGLCPKLPNDSSKFLNGVGGYTVPGSGVFGSDFQYAESEGESTTTSGSYQQKLKLQWTPPVAGDYLIQWACEITNSSSSYEVGVKVELDDSTVLNEFCHEPESGDSYEATSGMKKVTLTAASHDIDIDFKEGGLGTAKIRRARLIAWRVN